MKPNIPKGKRIVMSDIAVVGPDETTRRITEVLSSTDVLDEEQAKLSLNPQARKFTEALDELKNLLVGNHVANNFAQSVARDKLISLGGVASKDILERLKLALSDPSNLDIVYFLNWNDLKPSRKQQSFHVDGYKVGDLRIGLSNELQSVFRLGPHVLDPTLRKAEPYIADGKDLTSEVQPEPGSIVLWHSEHTAHRAPNTPSETPERSIGLRRFGTLSVGFNRVLEQIR